MELSGTKGIALLTAVMALALPGAALGVEGGPATSRFSFSIQSVKRIRGGWSVITPGARFELGAGGARCFQRIAARREVACVTIPGRRALGWKLDRNDSNECRLTDSTGAITAVVTGDSVLRIRGAPKLVVAGAKGLDAEYRHRAEASAIFADASGGAGAYGPKGALCEVSGLNGGRWEVSYPMLNGQDVLVSVFPPRRFDWEQARRNVIVHYFPRFLPRKEREESGFQVMSDRPLPTDEELTEWRKVGNVLVLHLEIWRGFGVKDIQPVDPDRLAAVMKRAHELRWKVLLYTSPYYYKTSPKIEDFEAEMRHILSYGADGLYWDGTYLGVEKAWEIAKRARKLLGDRLLYVHCTSTPFSQPRMFCPFVDTYADFILRGEVFDRKFMDPCYLRYLVSGYNLSNAIGTLCYETCRLDKQMVEAVLGVNARIPFWPGGQITDDGKEYFLRPDERKLFVGYYLPAASRIANERSLESWAAASGKERRTWLAANRKETARKISNLKNYLETRKKALRAAASANLAAFKPITASDTAWTAAGMHGLGPLPQYANDGSDETYWAADFAPQWLEVDLGAVDTVRRIVVRNYFGDGRFYHYDLQVSSDRLHWRTVARKTDNSPATPAGESFSVPEQRARYVRALMLANSANVGLHMCEMEVYR